WPRIRTRARFGGVSSSARNVSSAAGRTSWFRRSASTNVASSRYQGWRVSWARSFVQPVGIGGSNGFLPVGRGRGRVARRWRCRYRSAPRCSFVPGVGTVTAQSFTTSRRSAAVPVRTPRTKSRTRLKMTEIRPDLPAPLSPLRGLARNLRWAWHAPTRSLFERLDPSLWEATRHNPIWVGTVTAQSFTTSRRSAAVPVRTPRTKSRTRLKMTEIRPDLPAPLSPLRGLARNLRWAWHAPTRSLFERLDPSLWEATRHNPVRMLWELAQPRLAAFAADKGYLKEMNTAAADLEAYLRDENTWFRRAHPQSTSRIAYFSAEFGIAECLRIYSGGLGVLAGDHLKSASDLGVPLVGVGLMYREGYFTQRIDAVGVQHDVYERADFERLPITLELGADGQPLTVDLPFLDHRIHARIWRADVGRVPLYLLDTDL